MSTDDIEQAVARGGPGGGTALGAADAASYEVRMAELTPWAYLAYREHEQLPDGSLARAHVAAGRV